MGEKEDSEAGDNKKERNDEVFPFLEAFDFKMDRWAVWDICLRMAGVCQEKVEAGGGCGFYEEGDLGV